MGSKFAPASDELSPPGSLKRKKWEGEGWGLFLALSLSVLACLPLLAGQGLINTRAGGDSPFLLVRLHQLVANLRGGVFPARWMPDAAYGLGYPFFNYYAPLAYYVAAPFKLLGLGFIRSIELTQALGFLAAAGAMYLLARELLHSRAGAVLAALAYTYAPFHLVNVYVRGDSLSEFYAFVFYPLIFWALLRLRRASSMGNVALVALAYGGLVLTHNVSALIFSPFVILYALFVNWGFVDSECGPPFIGFVRSLTALGLGLALSAWFWLPALLERGYVQLEAMTTGYFHYSNHFRGLDLVQRRFLFDYAVEAGRTPFAMGLVQAILALAGAAAMAARWARRRRVEPQSAFALAVLALSTFLITPLSRPLWDHLPLLPFVQFPWRFLSVQAFASSLVVGYLGAEVSRLRRGEFIVLLLGAGIVATSMLGLRPEYLPIGEADVTVERLSIYEYFTANIGTTVRHEYLPRWAVPRPFTSEVLLNGGQKPPPLVMEGELAETRLLARGPTREEWAVTVSSPRARLAFHTYYFPGWRASVDGEPREVWPVENLGHIGLDLERGEHRVVLSLGRTPLRAWSEALSLAALVTIAILLLKGRQLGAWRQKARRVGLAAIGILLFAVLLPRFSAPPHSPSLTDLTMDFARMPYLHHNPRGVDFGGMVRLVGYQLSSEEVMAGETLEVLLHWEEVRGEGLRAEVRLLSPAEHLFGVPACLAQDDAALSCPHPPPPRMRGGLGRGDGGCGVTRHLLRVPEEAVRGLYLLAVQVKGPQGEVEPVTEGGQTLGTTYLKPVRVRNWRRARGDEPVLARFGPGIVLTEVQTEQVSPQALEVRLTWRAERAIPANLGLALRLPQVGASLDTQPHRGFYPTSLWRAGELVDDRHLLPLPEGTPPGEYSLEIVLYEIASLAPVGTAQIPGVALTKPTIKASYPVLHRFGELALVSLSAPSRLRQGQPLTVKAKWAAEARPARDYACRLSLLDEWGAVVHSQTEPLSPTYPTSRWPKGAIVAARYRLSLDPLLPPGRYSLAVAVLDPRSGESLGQFLSPLTIEERERSYAIPPLQVRLNVDFGGQVRLLGYDLAREGDELRLTLHWQALRRMEGDYKVFVHLFDPATEAIVAQHDAMPRQNRYPTSWWAKGEVVSDAVTLSLEGVPEGDYRLAVGLYDPETLERLAAIDAEGNRLPDDRLILPEPIPVPCK